jgi:imidazole glycerol phosphate synthase glutamine amidotransferase subunit
MIAIINYGAGNLINVKNMLDYIGVESIITSNSEDVNSASKVILPGVCAFGYLMENLKQKKLDTAIKESINSGKPFLGICIGFQALFEESEEDSGVQGLCVFKGKVKKLRQGKVPHTGWNNVRMVKSSSNFESGFAYFNHSFCPEPEDKEIILFKTNYYVDFCSGVQNDNVVGVQFHPERSGKWGINFYKKWLSDTND